MRTPKDDESAFKDWPQWKQGTILNILAAVGVALGFATSGAKVSPRWAVPIALFIFAAINLIFFDLVPRIAADKQLGKQSSLSDAFVRVLRERPLTFLLLVNQLIGASQLLTIAVSLMEVLGRGGTPSTASVQKSVWYAFLFAAIAGIWLLSAAGLWQSRAWAWWMTLVLNSIHVLFILAVQILALFVLKKHESLVGWNEIAAAVALIILMLPAVRVDFLGRRSISLQAEC